MIKDYKSFNRKPYQLLLEDNKDQNIENILNIGRDENCFIESYYFIEGDKVSIRIWGDDSTDLIKDIYNRLKQDYTILQTIIIGSELIGERESYMFVDYEQRELKFASISEITIVVELSI